MKVWSGEETEGEEQMAEKSREDENASKPWFVYPLLAAAVLAVSSSGPVFSTMREIRPFLLSAWRLSITAALLMPMGIYQIIKLSPEQKMLMVRQSPLIISSGFLLCFHYGAWVESIETTSLAHAVLAVSTSPIFLAIGAWILRKPISYGELIGTAFAIGGLAVMTLSSGAAGSEKEATVYGDIMGLAGSILFTLYLLIGRSLRTWMPIFAYVLPVNGTAALGLCASAVVLEGAGFNGSLTGLFGQFFHWQYFWRCFYMAAVPGIVGHVSFNALLKWLHPLIIALPSGLEAPLGTLLGIALGSGSVPGLTTYIGGTVLIVATIGVIFASYKREERESGDRRTRQLARDQLDLELVAELGDLPYRGAASSNKEYDDEESSLIKHKEDS